MFLALLINSVIKRRVKAFIARVKADNRDIFVLLWPQIMACLGYRTIG